jgi:hypothetical protein
MKFMYLAKRKPGFTPDEFVRRWRMHGAVGLSTSFSRHMLLYVQAEVIHPAPIDGASDEHDAVAYLVTHDDAFFGTPSAEDAAGNETMLADELKTFSGPIPPVMIFVDEKVFKEGGHGGVTAFLYFVDPAYAQPVAAHYQNSDDAVRVVLNTEREDLALPGSEPVHPYKAIVEVSALDLGTLESILRPGDAEPWRSADLTVVTREAVLWDRVS